MNTLIILLTIFEVLVCLLLIGVILLQRLGVEAELLAAVAAHHQPASPEDTRALQLLRQADDLN